MTAPAEFHTFTFPSPPPSSVPSSGSSAVSSQFSVWSDESEDDDECLSVHGDLVDEPVFENVTPISPHQSSDDLFAMSIAAREELSKATLEDEVDFSRGPTSRARMAIYIPSTSTSTSEEIVAISRKATPALSVQVPAFRAVSVVVAPRDEDASDIEDDEVIEDEIAHGQIFYPAIPEPKSSTSTTAPRSFAGSYYNSPAFQFSREEGNYDDLLASYQ